MPNVYSKINDGTQRENSYLCSSLMSRCTNTVIVGHKLAGVHLCSNNSKARALRLFKHLVYTIITVKFSSLTDFVILIPIPLKNLLVFTIPNYVDYKLVMLNYWKTYWASFYLNCFNVVEHTTSDSSIISWPWSGTERQRNCKMAVLLMSSKWFHT